MTQILGTGEENIISRKEPVVERKPAQVFLNQWRWLPQ